MKKKGQAPFSGCLFQSFLKEDRDCPSSPEKEACPLFASFLFLTVFTDSEGREVKKRIQK
jgi:hypothetical protein